MDQENKKGGFVKLILLIIIALIIMKYFDISISGVIDWIKELINSVL